MDTLNFGRAVLTWLQGGVTHLDGGAMFGVVPKPLWSKKYPVNDNNQIELRTDPILIQLDGKKLLIDTGIGKGKLSEKQKRNFGALEESTIHDSLHALGLTALDIDYVLMTHLHFDHACGLTEWQNGELQPVFPKATIIVNEIEWQEMKDPNIRSANTYWEENWRPIEQDVKTFQDQVEVVPGVEMIHTGGHSNGHSIIRMEMDNDILLHMADIMPTHAHQHKLWVLAYDDYPVTSVHAKEKWMEYGYHKQAWYTFYHDAHFRALRFNEEGEPINKIERNTSS
ncbi:MBL fold metallo-hydrolase [Pontibacillus salicampi]|uniref:MBL fold metallo-hydrolase n=1 Tax=Pontibacillus salicampi TaxID=1449801 RepID=A0ABV6LIP4_9BACI